MPKHLNVDPKEVLKSGKIRFRDIPVKTYDRPIAWELADKGEKALRDVLRHMMVIREFESMLGTFKAKGEYRGIPYNYKGPAHLSMGQEAAAVGQALALDPADFVFGSHRSHGEFLAKGLAAITKLDETSLADVLDQHVDGGLRDTVVQHLGGQGQELAENFLLFGFLAEIFMRSNGFNGGMGGSMHAFFLPFGAYPNNAIVGASSGIATGAALRRKLAGDPQICVANSGDGSTGCGLVWESMNFASMAQMQKLWGDDKRGALPVLFFFTNNFYAMGGQTSGETMGWDRLSRIGAGINPNQMHAETIDGTNPLAVAEAVSRKREVLLAGEGPALLDVECYRYNGHSTTDANAYRSREELKAWEPYDPIVQYSERLTEAGIMSSAEIEDMRANVVGKIEAVTRAVVDPNIAPIVDIPRDPTLIGKLMFNDELASLPETEAPLLKQPEESAAFRGLKRKARFGLGEDGNMLSGMRAITLRDGLTEAILHHMTHDESLIAYGEECREWGGAFGVYRGLSDVIPYHRLFNSPISEAAIVSVAVGYAMAGGRALVELMYGDFLGRSGDEVFNQMAKWQSMSNGMIKLPVVLRASIGSKYGAQHSQDWSSLVAHIPGLKVVYPATPYDAKGLMATALASNDPVVFLESQRLYDRLEVFQQDGVPQDYYQIPFGKPDIKREGQDITVLTIGPSLYQAITAADELAAMGIEAEIIDARTLVPFDYDVVLASVKKTSKLLVVSEASERGSFAQTLAATVARHGFSDLNAPPRVLGTPNWIVPGADMEDTYFPQSHDIIDVVTAEFFPEKKTNQRGIRNWDDLDLARRAI